MKLAGVLSWLVGLGIGLPCVYAIGYPFTRMGIETSVPLLVGFLVVYVAELVVGLLLWHELTVGAWAALVRPPVELVFWAGFALPLGFVFGLARTALVVVALSR